MKTYKQRTEDILAAFQKKHAARKKHTVAALTAMGTCAAVLAVTLLLWPYSKTPPSVDQHKDAPYYSVIQALNEAMYTPPQYDNALDEFLGDLGNIADGLTGNASGAAPEMNAPGASPDANDRYTEVTDNQVQGVIEGDLFKRSDTHVFYLRNDSLQVYTIDRENSRQVGSYDVGKTTEWAPGAAEMYLSGDCKTLTLVQSGSIKNENDSYSAMIKVLQLDVSDPTNIRQKEHSYITGSYLSSRMVDDKLLVISQFYVNSKNVDFKEESTFLPQMGKPGAMVSIAPEDIHIPQKVNRARYTVVCQLGKDLQNLGSAAFLGYSQELYVSKDHVFATCTYTEKQEADGYVSSKAMTTITALRYSGEKLECVGSVDVAGSVKDQYSMDEYQSILRVVTTISESKYKESTSVDGEYLSMLPGNSTVNASLYCISLQDLSVVSKKEAFAPEGEQVRSVRFDGTTAYVCTSLQLKDPVFFFDLSDLNNITCKDTGTIDGYSSSLVNFGDGLLLGIGYSGRWGLKIELYEESDTGVVSVCFYEHGGSFSEDYKSYFIDRQRQLVGLGVNNSRYILLAFNGYELVEVVNCPLAGDDDTKRAFIDGDWLYMLGQEFRVEKI